MKKLVIISVAFAIMLAVSVWQIKFSVRLYDSILDDLYAIERMTGDTPKSVDSPEIVSRLDSVMEKWYEGRGVLFTFGNHSALRLVEEKLIFMDATFRGGDLPAVPAAIRNAISLVEAVSNDDLPVITNLL